MLSFCLLHLHVSGLCFLVLSYRRSIGSWIFAGRIQAWFNRDGTG